jgi:glycosyltransferase involved in cell wall biosynthesis
MPRSNPTEVCGEHSGRTKVRILFITWDGPGLTYLESLFVPIFAGLHGRGFEFDVLQFSWTDRGPASGAKDACERAGIGYRRVETWRRPRPLGPFLSVIAGARHVIRAAHDFGSDMLMPRSIMPALAVLAAKRALPLPILYDADGLAADERVDFAGLSPRGVTYRLLRRIEDRMVGVAQSNIVRTSFAAEILAQRSGASSDRFFVAPNGRDPLLFGPGNHRDRRATRTELGVPEAAPLIVYAGSVGGKYDTARIGAFAKAVRQLLPETRLLVMTAEPEAARALILAEAPDLETNSIFMRAAPADVARYLAAGDIGTAFIKPTFSMRAAAAIKTSEYLLCGVPVVGASAVGENAAATSRGVFFDDTLGDQSLARLFAEQVLANRDRLRTQARDVGIAEFSLDRSVESYALALNFAVGK